MPTVDSFVGPLQLPAPAGEQDAPIQDATAAALVDYCAFWLQWGLNAKLATMTRPRQDSATPLDASPVANRYTTAPSALYLTRKLPALFVWWDGTSKEVQYSITQWMNVRDFKVLWIFERISGSDAPELLQRYSGLIATANALFARAFDRLAHPGYTLAGSGFAAGTDIRTMFSLRGVEYEGGQEGFLKELPQKSARDITISAGKRSLDAAQGGIVSGYPALFAKIRTWEDIGLDHVSDPDDVLRDGSLGITTGGTPVMTRVLPAPDGTEPGSGFPQD